MKTFLLLSVFCLSIERARLITTEDPYNGTTEEIFYDIYCKDAIDNCWAYGKESCTTYESWAKENCNATCNYCPPPPTEIPPCNDTSECAAVTRMDTSICHNEEFHQWTLDNCRLTCRFCPAEQLEEIDSHTTTLSPEDCKDKVDCPGFGDYVCKGDYKPWGIENCPRYCNFCIGVSTPSPPCIDTRPNCAAYGEDICTNIDYRPWAQENCRKYCYFCGPKPTVSTVLNSTDTSQVPAHGTTIGFPTPPTPLTPPTLPTTGTRR